jgi:hypothetical protein
MHGLQQPDFEFGTPFRRRHNKRVFKISHGDEVTPGFTKWMRRRMQGVAPLFSLAQNFVALLGS